MGDRSRLYRLRYIISHTGQLSLLPSAGQKMTTGQRLAFCGREGNRRSGVTLVCVTDCGISTYGLNGLWKADEHPDLVAGCEVL